MSQEIDYTELPRAFQRFLGRTQPAEPTVLSRRSFMKLAGVGGLALGVFPRLVKAQATDSARIWAKNEIITVQTRFVLPTPSTNVCSNIFLPRFEVYLAFLASGLPAVLEAAWPPPAGLVTVSGLAAGSPATAAGRFFR